MANPILPGFINGEFHIFQESLLNLTEKLHHQVSSQANLHLIFPKVVVYYGPGRLRDLNYPI